MVKNKFKLSYMPAFDLFMLVPNGYSNDKKKLTPAEKIVLIALFRFGVQPTTQKNKTLAYRTGFRVRWVEKIIERLVNKKVIARKIRTIKANGEPKSRRLITPLFGPKKYLVDFLPIEQSFEQRPNNQTGNNRTIRRGTTERTDDLSEYREKKSEEKCKKESTPSPLPAVRQAQALPKEQQREDTCKNEKLNKEIELVLRKTFQPLSYEQFQQRLQEQKTKLGIK